MTDAVPEPRRKDVFRALVEAQDQGHTVDDSRIIIAGKCGLQVTEVQAIEEEGLNKTWSPL